VHAWVVLSVRVGVRACMHACLPFWGDTTEVGVTRG